MPRLNLMLIKNHIYSIGQFLEKRRAIICAARALPPGHARNQIRQVASLLGALLRDRVWLRAHTHQAPGSSRKSGDTEPSRDPTA